MAGKYLSLLVHFTWSTKGREPWLEAEMRDDLRLSFIRLPTPLRTWLLNVSPFGPEDVLLCRHDQERERIVLQD